jgi:hypothetical protein
MYTLTLNGAETSAYGISSFPSTGFSATTGNQVQSWTIETKLIEAVTNIGLMNSPNVQGPITYSLYDGFDSLTEVVGKKVGDIVSVMAENIERIVITTNVNTTDNQPPKNLKLYLKGCFQATILLTKAQIELRDTTTTRGN